MVASKTAIICIVNRGSYTSDHFIWNLLNRQRPLANLINFIWNDHSLANLINFSLANLINFIWNDYSCKVLFIIWSLKCDFIAFKVCFSLTSKFVYFNENLHCCLRNRSAPAVNCWVIIHCLEVSCKEDKITSAQREWFIFVQLTDKRWIITQQFTHWSWSISILTHNKRRKHIRSLQLLPTFRHCTEELPPILRLRRIRLHVIVTSFKRKNDVTPSNAMNDVIFQWRQLSHT